MTEAAAPTKKVLPVQEKEQEVETAYFRLTDQGASGFIQEGTEKLPQPNEKTAPSNRSILTHSHYREIINGKLDTKNIYIRYVANCDEILVSEQKKADVVVNPKLSRINFKDGIAVFAIEGRNIAKVAYLRKASFCGTNPNRDPNEPIIWEEVFPDKERTIVNEKAFLRKRALAIIEPLAVKENGLWNYNVDKLTAFCAIIGVDAESPAGMVNVLIAHAENDPEIFIKKVTLYEKQFLGDILKAVDLGVIKVEETAIAYVGKDKVIITFPDSLDKEQKLLRLSDHFRSKEGSEDYREFKVELDSKLTQNTGK